MRRLLSATETLAALSLLLIALLTAGNVALRYAFSMQIPDWFDGTQMLQGIAMFWGIALATYYGTHIGEVRRVLSNTIDTLTFEAPVLGPLPLPLALLAVGPGSDHVAVRPEQDGPRSSAGPSSGSGRPGSDPGCRRPAPPPRARAALPPCPGRGNSRASCGSPCRRRT